MDRFDNVATTMQFPSEEARTQSVPIWEVPMMGIPGLHELLESEGKKHKGKKRKKKKNHKREKETAMLLRYAHRNGQLESENYMLKNMMALALASNRRILRDEPIEYGMKLLKGSKNE